MSYKFEKILVLIVICCQLGFVNCDPIKNIDKHKQLIEPANNEVNEQPKITELTTKDSIHLIAFDQKRDRLRNRLLNQKQSKLSDKLKSYSIEGDWQLTKSHWLKIEINEKSFITLGVDTATMRIYGNDGCNSIFGELLIFENDRIEIGTIGGTKAACLGVRGIYDGYFRESLQEARTFKIKGLNLFLFNKDEDILLEFERIVWEE